MNSKKKEHTLRACSLIICGGSVEFGTVLGIVAGLNGVEVVVRTDDAGMDAALLQLQIEMRHRHAHVGRKEKHADTKGQDAQKLPSDEGELDNEGLEAVAVHELLGDLKGAALVKRGIFRHHVIDQQVGIALDNAGNHKKQRPEKRKQALQEEHKDGVHEIAGLVNVEDFIRVDAAALRGTDIHTLNAKADRDGIEESYGNRCDGTDSRAKKLCNAGNQTGDDCNDERCADKGPIRSAKCCFCAFL